MASNTKQALLQALSAAEGGYISGQRLAETLGVSRAAVHKAAAALAAQGYALHSAPRRGYRLTGGDRHRRGRHDPVRLRGDLARRVPRRRCG